MTDLTVKAGNDANVAALGELWKGGGAGHHNMIMVTLGTGVGGGIIINDKVIAGSHGAGGEIGHAHVIDACRRHATAAITLSGAGSFRDRYCETRTGSAGSNECSVGDA
mgnify:CR=1 FL=1